MKSTTLLWLISFLLLAEHSKGQTKVPELYEKVRSHLPALLRKTERLFRREANWHGRLALKNKYGDDVLGRLIFVPDIIEMKFPEYRNLDTTNKYENFKQLRFSKRKDFVRDFIVLNDEVIGVLETSSVNDIVALDLKMYWSKPEEQQRTYSLYQAEYDSLRKYQDYLTVMIKNTKYWGFNIILDKDATIFTTYNCSSYFRTPECFVSLEEGLQKSGYKHWKMLFKNR